jgi:hypothetical protein
VQRRAKRWLALPDKKNAVTALIEEPTVRLDVAYTLKGPGKKKKFHVSQFLPITSSEFRNTKYQNT